MSPRSLMAAASALAVQRQLDLEFVLYSVLRANESLHSSRIDDSPWSGSEQIAPSSHKLYHLVPKLFRVSLAFFDVCEHFSR
jgi:hypothetical protein